MADISIMKRQLLTKWIKNSTLLGALCLPFTLPAADKLVVIVGEPPIEKRSVLDTPAPEAASPKTESPKSENTEPLQTAEAPPIIRPNIDVLKQQEESIEFITLNSVLFAHNGTALDNRAKQILNEIAAYMHDNEIVDRLLINGFADKTASANYNAKLSAKRAFVVREYLRHIGVSTNLLHTVSWGESFPTDEHWTNNGRKRNRRVELYLIQKQKAL